MKKAKKLRGHQPDGQAIACGYQGVAHQPFGQALAPPGFEDWPIIGCKIGGLWEVRARGTDYPVPVYFGRTPQYFFHSALGAALALRRLAGQLGYSRCREALVFSTDRVRQ